MKRSNKITLMLIVFILGFGFLFPANTKTKGLGTIKMVNNGEIRLDDETPYNKLTDVVPDMKEWIEDVPGGKDIDKDKFMEELFDKINRCWNEAIDSIQKDPNLSQDYKSKFNQRVNNKTNAALLVFEEGVRGHGSDWHNVIPIPLNSIINDETWNGNEWGSRTLEDCYFKKIVDYVAGKLAKGDSNWDDFKDKLPNYIATLIHEIMHYFGKVKQTKEEEFREEHVKRYECIVECMAFLITGIAGKDLKNCYYHCEYLHKECLDAAGCTDWGWSKKHHINWKRYWADAPDDNYSYYNAILSSSVAVNFPSSLTIADNSQLSFIYHPDVLIYNRFNSNEMANLLDRFIMGNYMDDNSHDHFPNYSKEKGDRRQRH